MKLCARFAELKHVPQHRDAATGARGRSEGLKRRNLMIQKSHRLLQRYLNSRIIYNMLSEEAWMKFLNSDDPAIRETLKVFRQNAAFPQAPAKIADNKTARLS